MVVPLAAWSGVDVGREARSFWVAGTRERVAPPSIIQVRPLWSSRTWRSGSELPVAAFAVWGPDTGLWVRRFISKKDFDYLIF